MTTTVTCKFFRSRIEGENIVVEMEDAMPSNLVPQLMSKKEVAGRLSISVRKVEEFARLGELPIVRIGGAVRFKEMDVILLQNKNLGPKPRVIELPKRKKAAY